jgi:hypothetical protein
VEVEDTEAFDELFRFVKARQPPLPCCPVIGRRGTRRRVTVYGMVVWYTPHVVWSTCGRHLAVTIPSEFPKTE